MELFLKKLKSGIANKPELQQAIAKANLIPADAVMMSVDMNDRRSDFRRVAAEGWCQANATRNWRRRIIERVGEEVVDRVLFEFEVEKDADRLRDLLAARKW